MTEHPIKNAGPLYVIFTVDKEYDFMAGKGYDGKDIVVNPRWFDPSSNDSNAGFQSPVSETPVDYVRTFGKVVAIPEKLHGKGNWTGGYKEVVDEVHAGKPVPRLYWEKNSTGTRFRLENYIYIDDIAPEVEVGQRIYFDESVLDNPHQRMAIDIDGELYYSVKYPHIICAVDYKGGHPKGKTKVFADDDRFVEDEEGHLFEPTITMIGSWVLLEPKMEDEEDILVPVRDEAGNVKDKSLWIQTKSRQEIIHKYATVAHIGTPYKGFHKAAEVGDEVVYAMVKNDKTYTITVEGKQYYAMKQRDILGVIQR